MILPEKTLLRASQWCYRGLWSVITKYFFVPSQAPSFKHTDPVLERSFRPAEGFLKYLKFYFWFGLIAIDSILFVLWIILLFNAPAWLSVILTPIIWIVMVLPDIVAYIAIHLRYDSTWYLLSDRSLRIRRGIWCIHETTITYENIQKVTFSQGPLQRYFGIANVQVETAGGGSAEGQSSIGHLGVLEGVDCAEEIRHLIMEKWKMSKSTGLGDDVEGDHQSKKVEPIFSPQQIELLEEIRDFAVSLAAR